MQPEFGGSRGHRLADLFWGCRPRTTRERFALPPPQAVQGDYTAWYRLLAENPQILAAVSKGYASPGALSGDEKRLFFVTLQIIVFSAQNAFSQGRNGHLPEGIWAMYENGLAISMRSEGGRTFWHERRWLFSSAFQTAVDAAISRPMDPGARLIFAIPDSDSGPITRPNLRTADIERANPRSR